MASTVRCGAFALAGTATRPVLSTQQLNIPKEFCERLTFDLWTECFLVEIRSSQPSELHRRLDGADHWIDGALQFFWVLLFVLLAFEAMRFRSLRQASVFLTLMAIGLTLRLVLSPWGPGDIRINMAPGLCGSLDTNWGQASFSLLRLVAHLHTLSQHDVMVMNLVASSLVPPFMYLFLRSLDFGQIPSFAAAIVASSHPVLLRFASTLDRTPWFLLTGLVGSFLALRYLRHRRVALLAGALLAALLTDLTRPEAPLFTIFTIIWLFAIPGKNSVRILLASTLVLIAGLPQFLPGRSPPSIGLANLGYFRVGVMLDPFFTPWAVIVGSIVGTVLAGRDRRNLFNLGTFVSTNLLLAMALGGWLVAERNIASSRYHVIQIVPVGTALAFLFGRLNSLPKWPRRLAFVISMMALAISFAQPCSSLLEYSTFDYEYAFLSRELAKVPSDATVITLQPKWGDSGFPGLYDVRRPNDMGSAMSPFETLTAENCDAMAAGLGSSHLFYYAGSICAPTVEGNGLHMGDHSVEILERCKNFRETLRGEPLAEQRVPARAMAWSDFIEPTVKFSLYRLDALPCEEIFATR